MTLAQVSPILSMGLWFLILVGPPLALALLAPMMYVDGATRGFGQVPVRTSNWSMFVILLLGFSLWILLLKLIYFPIIGFTADFLTFDNVTRFDYGNLKMVNALWSQTLSWIGRAPVQALLLLLVVPLLGTAVLIVARVMGRSAALPGPVHGSHFR
ncbi:MAG TPA: hypothetical protein VM536_10395 [Chloroflexia bacterium]|nr:hypothetical protein [Chloroflexia bacterium]